MIKIETLNMGEIISYSGELLVMRDAAHKRIQNLMLNNQKLPVDFNKKIIFYAGPAKKPINCSSGSIGPTTSNRMDNFLEMTYKLGVLATIGKGERSKFVTELCKKYNRVYFSAPSGCAAVLSKKIISNKIIAFENLGTESIQLLEVKSFPLFVSIDSKGKSFYKGV